MTPSKINFGGENYGEYNHEAKSIWSRISYCRDADELKIFLNYVFTNSFGSKEMEAQIEGFIKHLADQNKKSNGCLGVLMFLITSGLSLVDGLTKAFRIKYFVISRH